MSIVLCRGGDTSEVGGTFGGGDLSSPSPLRDIESISCTEMRNPDCLFLLFFYSFFRRCSM